jgi:hypothetical protein
VVRLEEEWEVDVGVAVDVGVMVVVVAKERACRNLCSRCPSHSESVGTRGLRHRNGRCWSDRRQYWLHTDRHRMVAKLVVVVMMAVMVVMVVVRVVLVILVVLVVLVVLMVEMVAGASVGGHGAQDPICETPAPRTPPNETGVPAALLQHERRRTMRVHQ